MIRPFLCIAASLIITAGLSWSTSTASEDLVIPEQVLEAQRERIDAIARASECTVAVFSAGKAGGGGSGVVISAAASIYSAYIMNGQVKDGEQEAWRERAVQEAVELARRLDDLIVSDDEMG